MHRAKHAADGLALALLGVGWNLGLVGGSALPSPGRRGSAIGTSHEERRGLEDMNEKVDLDKYPPERLNEFRDEVRRCLEHLGFELSSP